MTSPSWKKNTQNFLSILLSDVLPKLMICALIAIFGGVLILLLLDHP